MDRRNFQCLFGTCFVFRMCCLIAQNSFNVPDEYWQSLEVAHRIVFGYGYLTWEWIEGIRSYVYVSWIVGLYKLLHLSGLDSVQNLTLLPNVVQGTITAFSDTCFIAFAVKLYGCDSARVYWTVWPYITNVYLAYCATRTLANTIETNLMCICLYLYPVTYGEKLKKYSYFWLVCLACIIRPTAAVFWTPMCFHHIISTHRPVVTLLKHFIPKLLIMLTSSTLLDCYIFGRWTLTWWNFLRINLLENVSAQYSTNSVFWYFSVGLPVVLGPTICSFYKTIFMHIHLRNHQFQHEKIFQNAILFTLAVFSFIPHKEFRYMLPLMPVMTIVSSNQTATWMQSLTRFKRYLFSCSIMLISLYAFYFLSKMHQVGTVKVINFLSHPNNSLLFLMPCHHTPLYSHLHVNITARFLHCDPKLTGDENYVDETLTFYNNPLEWLDKEYGMSNRSYLPTHIIMYDVLQRSVDPFLKTNGYIEWLRLYHSVFVTRKSGSHVLVFNKTNST